MNKMDELVAEWSEEERERLKNLIEEYREREKGLIKNSRRSRENLTALTELGIYLRLYKKKMPAA